MSSADPNIKKRKKRLKKVTKHEEKEKSEGVTKKSIGAAVRLPRCGNGNI
ncbi:MAG: hypothetical protein IJV84_06865 [Bacteroidales bacterium]|nr:hypothetical protein [Bacteroidales bacterium]